MMTRQKGSGAMEQQARGAMSGAVIDAGSAHCPPGVSVYDADGERLGMVSDWQDVHNFLIVHHSRLVGHDTYVPHAAIKYSDMNGVHLRLRQVDLTSMQQPLPDQTMPHSLPISLSQQILAPDMGTAAVAASAFAVDAISALANGSSEQFAIEAARENTAQTSAFSERWKSRQLW
jgi:hypothetical protein